MEYGRALRGSERSFGAYQVFGTNGPIGWHSTPLFDHPGVVVGRKGAYRGIHYAQGPPWVIDTAFFLRLKESAAVDSKFAYYQLLTVDLNSIDSGSAIPSTSRDAFNQIPVLLPPVQAQRKIASVLTAYDDLIENNNRRIKILEEIGRRIYREWFVAFRYPGHESVRLVDSELGPIPQGWEVRTVKELAGSAKHSVASGPFGSKLGRADYLPKGVPVIRGTNLAVGGGFLDDGFVFVSNAKADELSSCAAGPGDIVITQRGTLGQVGVIPTSARHSRYLLSQSQMKITVDRTVATAAYTYAAIRSGEVTDRIQNMAISAGVPHINLTMLRELRLLAPPLELQEQFEGLADPAWVFANHVFSANERLRATRALLLPRLISGEIDVENLDIEAPEAAA